MTTANTDPAMIAMATQLSEAQKRWLTDRAEWRKPRPWAEVRWMTFPPAGTHRVLQRLGLVDGVGQISAAGLQIRTILKEHPNDQG